MNTVPAPCPRCGSTRSHPDDPCPRCAFAGALESPATEDFDPDYIDRLPVPKETALIAGKYEILNTLARGGMGVVYHARSLDLKRTVALKMIRGGRLATPDEMRRFRTEAEAAAHLDHPNIVPIYDVDEHDGEPFFAMKLVEGASLAQRIAAGEFRATRANARAMQTRIAALMAKVARAVHHAHQRGVLHRDLKSSNVLVDAAGEPHLTDFGLAKLLELESQGGAHPTQSEAVLGTPSYMSPEQARGNSREVTTSADVYSLGAILYDLLTGRPPFVADNPAATMWQVINQEPPRPTGIAREVAGELEVICLKCLEKEADRRYASAEAVAKDLERWIRGEPIEAQPSGVWTRACKWARRRPAIAALAAALACTILGAFVTVTAQLHQKSLALAEQKKARVAEKLALEKTQAKEREARALLGFVVDSILTPARPRGEAGGLGWDVSLRQALKAALPSVGASFTNQPLVEAVVRFTLGMSLALLGETEVAAGEFRLALPTFRKLRGPTHSDTIGCMVNLANCYTELGQDVEAIYLKEEILTLTQTKLGPGHLDTLRSMGNLAVSYAAVGRFQEAVKLQKEALDRRKGLVGLDQADTLNAKINLAIFYNRLGRHVEAMNVQQESLELSRTKLGADHASTLTIMNSMAETYDDLDRSAEALELREAVLALRSTKLGQEHPDTLGTKFGVAASYDALGRKADALKLREDTLVLSKAKLGPNHPVTLLGMNNLAIHYDALGRRDEALELREEGLELTRSKLGPGHPDTLTCMENLAISYKAVGRNDEALKLQEETFALSKAKLGLDHRDTLWSMNNLGIRYDSIGRHVEALKLWEERLALQKAKLGANHRDSIKSMNELASVYKEAGRWSAVVALYEEVLKFTRMNLGPDHLDTLESMRRLANSCDNDARYAEALNLREESLSLCKSKLGPDDAGTLAAMNSLGISYYRLGRRPEALRLWEESLALCKGKLGLNHSNTFRSSVRLATAYLNLQRPADAEHLLVELLPSKRQAPPVTSGELVETLDLLGKSLLAQDKHVEAATALQELVSICESRSPGDWTTAKAKSRYGAALLGQKKFSEAETQLLQGYDGLKQRVTQKPGGSSIRRYREEAAAFLVDLYTAWDKPDKAAEWKIQLAEIDREAAADSNDPASPASSRAPFDSP